MPTFHVEMFEGRSVKQKRKFVEEMMRATRESLGCAPGTTDIVITGIKCENWVTGGMLRSERE